jgi:hypothetical protein
MPEAYLVHRIIAIKVAHFNPEYPKKLVDQRKLAYNKYMNQN